MNQNQLLHIAGEAIVISGVTIFLSNRIKKLENDLVQTTNKLLEKQIIYERQIEQMSIILNKILDDKINNKQKQNIPEIVKENIVIQNNKNLEDNIYKVFDANTTETFDLNNNQNNLTFFDKNVTNIISNVENTFSNIVSNIATNTQNILDHLPNVTLSVHMVPNNINNQNDVKIQEIPEDIEEDDLKDELKELLQEEIIIVDEVKNTNIEIPVLDLSNIKIDEETINEDMPNVEFIAQNTNNNVNTKKKIKKIKK